MKSVVLDLRQYAKLIILRFYRERSFLIICEEYCERVGGCVTSETYNNQINKHRHKHLSRIVLRLQL